MENNNNQPDSFALLNKVIETSEATIEHCIMLMNSREDIIRIDQKIDQSLINLNATFEKSFKFMEIEDQKRQNFLFRFLKASRQIFRIMQTVSWSSLKKNRN